MISKLDFGCQFLSDVLRSKDSMHRSITKYDAARRALHERLSRVIHKQVNEIRALRQGSHPLFRPSDYDRDGRVVDCMSIVERMGPEYRFSPFEKHAGYLSQLYYMDQSDAGDDDDDFLVERDLPADSYGPAAEESRRRSASAGDVLIPRSALSLASAAMESSCVLTSRVCVPITSVKDVYLAPAVQNQRGEWERGPVDDAKRRSISEGDAGFAGIDMTLRA